jgi:hypothetical protein
MINIFFSYSHEDEKLRNELDKHLSILKRNGVINAWHDRRIMPGEEFDKEISKNLKTADIILLLISADFLASDYCYDNEMKYALERHERNEAVVIPVILRPCDWKDTRFGKLQAVPTNGKPVVKFLTLDDAFLEITDQIKRVTDEINKTKNLSNIAQPPTREKEKVLVSRSSNLRIRKEFTDREKDKFLDEAFDYIANFFEGSLEELKKRNPQIDYRFKKIDSQTFTSHLYIGGKVVAECMIYYGAGSFMANRISYSRSISQSKNSYNESLHLEDDGYMIYLRATGMSLFGRSSKNELLTNEGAAELFWGMFIESLQRT